jgi:hypothetical protein
MRFIFLFMTLLTFNALASFEKLNVENLDLDYKIPFGVGTVKKVGMGILLAPEVFPIQINRTVNAFELTSPYVDFTWNRPLKLVYDVEEFAARGTSLSLGTDIHFVEGQYLMVKSSESGEFKAENLRAFCDGDAKGELATRLLEDCRTKLHLAIKKIDLPIDFYFLKILRSLPQYPEPDTDRSEDNVLGTIQNGEFFFQFYFNYLFRIGLRAWGHLKYENNHQVVALRMDTIKFGFIDVTDVVMNKMQDMIKSPDVIIDPPWIRINIEKIYDTQFDSHR